MQINSKIMDKVTVQLKYSSRRRRCDCDFFDMTDLTEIPKCSAIRLERTSIEVDMSTIRSTRRAVKFGDSPIQFDGNTIGLGRNTSKFNGKATHFDSNTTKFGRRAIRFDMMDSIPTVTSLDLAGKRTMKGGNDSIGFRSNTHESSGDQI
jgi:hypothetical protein